jgi:hypothetical protein
MVTSAAISLMALAACGGGGEETIADRPGAGPRMSAAHAGSGAPTYDLPDGWQETEPTSSMREQQFLLPGSEGAAEMVVYHFPGGGGTVDMNVDRWIGQFSQPDGSDSKEHAERRTVEVEGEEITIVDVSGTYDPGMMSGGTGPQTGYRMLAAIIEAPDGPWFYKVTGPRATVDRHESEFEAFVESLRLP